jgi:hypothetical protein
MCFLCGKGDRNIQFVEISDREPFIVEGLKYSGDQTKGACLVPKRAMDVMQGEVNRVMQLCDSSIVPITWQVPRKVHFDKFSLWIICVQSSVSQFQSYRDYHADIYPETFGLESPMGPADWWEDKCDRPVAKINLDPKKRPSETLTVFQETALSARPLKKEAPAAADDNGHANGHSKNGDGGAVGLAALRSEESEVSGSNSSFSLSCHRRANNNPLSYNR